MKFTPWGIAALLAIHMPVQAYNMGSITFSHDNDGIVGTDRNYSSGLFLELHSAISPSLATNAPPLIQIPAELLLQDGTKQGWSMRLSQQIWTPSDIEIVEPQPNERPYAGTMMFDTQVYQYTAMHADKFQGLIGIIGPASLAKDGQRWLHSIIGSDDPNGWEYQIDNTFLFQFGYERHQALLRNEFLNGLDIEFGAIGRANAGNYRSEAAVGGMLRFGSSLSQTYGAVGTMPGRYVETGFLATSPAGSFMYMGLEARYRFNDITITGDRPDPSYSINIEHRQISSVVGFVYYQPRWGASLSLHTSTKEFEEDRHSLNNNGSLSVFWRL